MTASVEMAAGSSSVAATACCAVKHPTYFLAGCCSTCNTDICRLCATTGHRRHIVVHHFPALLLGAHWPDMFPASASLLQPGMSGILDSDDSSCVWDIHQPSKREITDAEHAASTLATPLGDTLAVPFGDTPVAPAHLATVMQHILLDNAASVSVSATPISIVQSGDQPVGDPGSRVCGMKRTESLQVTLEELPLLELPVSPLRLISPRGFLCTGANFIGADFRGRDMRDCDMHHWDLRGAGMLATLYPLTYVS